MYQGLFEINTQRKDGSILDCWNYYRVLLTADHTLTFLDNSDREYVISCQKYAFTRNYCVMTTDNSIVIYKNTISHTIFRDNFEGDHYTIEAAETIDTLMIGFRYKESSMKLAVFEDGKLSMLETSTDSIRSICSIGYISSASEDPVSIISYASLRNEVTPSLLYLIRSKDVLSSNVSPTMDIFWLRDIACAYDHLKNKVIWSFLREGEMACTLLPYACYMHNTVVEMSSGRTVLKTINPISGITMKEDDSGYYIWTSAIDVIST